MDFDAFNTFTDKICDQTRSIILSHYESPELTVEMKPDDTPVTIADRDAERAIREAIQAQFPDHGIRGEEFADRNPGAAYTWVLDPIDGTKSFAANCPLFGTMIAFLKDGVPIYGCIDFPALDKRIVGNGQASWVDGEPVRVSLNKRLDEAIVLASDQNDIRKLQDEDAFRRLADSTRFTRTWGDCYGYYLLATGNADIMLDPEMSPWDIMALIPIVRGAGGCISDWQGNDPAKGNSIVATASNLHESVLKILNN
ncbi:MAG: histidinol-phosphatase [Opitutales bacterium TMED158]|nr:MAG: histidinol-phosphatase [Opitutales bacterium TMED158]